MDTLALVVAVLWLPVGILFPPFLFVIFPLVGYYKYRGAL